MPQFEEPAAPTADGRDRTCRPCARPAVARPRRGENSRAAVPRDRAAPRGRSRASSPRNHWASGTPKPIFGRRVTCGGSSSGKASSQDALAAAAAQLVVRSAAPRPARPRDDPETARGTPGCWPSRPCRPWSSSRRADTSPDRPGWPRSPRRDRGPRASLGQKSIRVGIGQRGQERVAVQLGPRRLR